MSICPETNQRCMRFCAILRIGCAVRAHQLIEGVDAKASEKVQASGGLPGVGEQGWAEAQIEQPRERHERLRAERHQRQLEEQERAAEAARRGQLLAEPYWLRVHLRTANKFVDLAVRVDFAVWMQALLQWQGITFDAGFIPLHEIILIGRLSAGPGSKMVMEETGNLGDSGNVVPFKH